MKNKTRRLFGTPRPNPKTKLRLLGLLAVLLLLSWILIKTVSEKTGGESVFVKRPTVKQAQEISITDSLIAKVKKEPKTVGYFSDFYNRATTFSNFADYSKSKEKAGKIQSPVSIDGLANELGSIEQGKVINFSAPARLYSQTGTEDVFVPFVSLKKEGERISVENVGEYWNIIQRNLNDLRKNGNAGEATELEKLLDKARASASDKRPYVVLNEKGGDIFSSSSGITTLNQTLADTVNVLKDEVETYKNNGDRAKENLLSDQLSSLLSIASSNQNYQEKIAGTIGSVANNAGMLFVETEDATNYYSTAEARCERSGGKWFFEECDCPTGSDLRIDGSCSSEDKLKSSCEESGGTWGGTDRSSTLLKVCGKERITGSFDNNDNQSSATKETSDKLALGNNYCDCPSNYCLSSNGICNKDDDDSDQDGVPNQKDNCPTAGPSQSGTINQEAGSNYYGCSCDQIGAVMKNCPESKCLGSHWTAYSKGKQECKDGHFLPYACDFEKEGLSKFCADPLQTGQLSLLAKESDGNTDRAGGEETNKDIKPEASEFPVSNLKISENKPDSSENQTDNSNSPSVISPSSSGNNDLSGSGSGDKSRLGVIPGPALKNDYLARDKTDWSKILPTVKSASGQNGLGGSSNGAGKAEGLKAALRRIYNQDYQTYKMIFTYLDTIKHMDGGGVCEGCGKAKVDYNAPYKVLDQILVHEAAHCAHACIGGVDGFTRREEERMAVEKQIGSAHFEKATATSKGTIYDLMEEFPSQRSQFVAYKGFEVRGYLARYWCSANPQGLNCGQKGEGFDLGDKSVFLDWLFNRAGFSNWPIRPVQAYEPKASKSGEYYYYGVQDGDANWGIIYATVSKAVPEPPDNTYGGYPYGFGKAVLGAKQKEEDVIRKFMAMSNQDLYPCKSDPAKIGLPPAFGCEGAPAPKLEEGGNVGYDKNNDAQFAYLP